MQNTKAINGILTETDDEDNRYKEAKSALSDALDCLDKLTNIESYIWQSAKSHTHQKTQQKYESHIHVGLYALTQLYINTTEADINEKELRWLFAAFIAHDYHKRKNSKKEFEITTEEAEEYIENAGLKNLCRNISADEIKSVMVAHHEEEYDDQKPRFSEPSHTTSKRIDLIKFADSFASAENIDDLKYSMDRLNRLIRTSSVGRLETATFTYHKIDRSIGEVTNVLNRAISKYLEDEFGFIHFASYERGAVYLDKNTWTDEEGNNKIRTNINVDYSDIYDYFRDEIEKGHTNYGINGYECGAFSRLQEENANRFDIGCKDIYLLGLDKCIRGVIQRAVVESEDTWEVTKMMKTKVENEINPYIETDIEVSTRRVLGLSRGVRTLLYILLILHKGEKGDLLPETDTEYMETGKEFLAKILRTFGVYSEKRMKELVQIKEADNNFRESFIGQWDYKYIIAQYIYEEYYDGRNPSEIVDEIHRQVIIYLKSNTPYNYYEQKVVNQIESEIKSYINNTVSVSGNNNTPNRELMKTHNQESRNNCDICKYPTKSKDHELYGSGGDGKILNNENMNDIDVYTEIGEGEFTISNSNDICYICQLELSIRKSINRNWGKDSDMLYVKFRAEYGYSPTIERTLEKLLKNKAVNLENSIRKDVYRFEDELLDKGKKPDECDSIVSELRLDEFKQFIDPREAYRPRKYFGGSTVPIEFKKEDEKEEEYTKIKDTERFKSTGAALSVGAYAGRNVEITTNEIHIKEENPNKFAAIEEELASEYPIFNKEMSLNNVECKLKQIALINKYFKKLDEKRGKNYDDERKIRFDNYLKVKTAFPGSRLLRLTDRMNIDKDVDPRIFIQLDERGCKSLDISEDRIRNVAEKAMSLRTTRETIHEVLKIIAHPSKINSKSKHKLVYDAIKETRLKNTEWNKQKIRELIEQIRKIKEEESKNYYQAFIMMIDVSRMRVAWRNYT